MQEELTHPPEYVAEYHLAWKDVREWLLILSLLVGLVTLSVWDEFSGLSTRLVRADEGYELLGSHSPPFGGRATLSYKGSRYHANYSGLAAAFFVGYPTSLQSVNGLSAYLEDESGNHAPVSVRLPSNSASPVTHQEATEDRIVYLGVLHHFPPSFCESNLILKANGAEVGRWRVSGLRPPRRVIAKDQAPKMQAVVLGRTIGLRQGKYTVDLFLSGGHDPRDQYEIRFAYTGEWHHGNSSRLWLQQGTQHDSVNMLGFGQRPSPGQQLMHVYGTVTRYRTWEETLELPPIHWFSDSNQPGWRITSPLGVRVECPDSSARFVESLNNQALVTFQYNLTPSDAVTLLNCPLYQEFRKPMKVLLAGASAEDEIAWWRIDELNMRSRREHPHSFYAKIPMPDQPWPEPATGIKARLVYRVDLENERFDLYVPTEWAQRTYAEAQEAHRQSLAGLREELAAKKRDQNGKAK
ncbi:MAG: hypothetical protein KF784_04620 [Fimbriimonadaceae bacterium]|nr:hypothetical protein [Fimbriimonadaceae bacterium]